MTGGARHRMAPLPPAAAVAAPDAAAAVPRSFGEHGQAAVELVALLPLLLAAALAGAALLAAQTAEAQAGQAAQAGAMALIQGGDPRAAALDALPGAARRRAAVSVRDRRITVRVRPSMPVPGLEGETTADAGPEPAP